MNTSRLAGWVPSDEQRAAMLAFEGYGGVAPKVVFVGIDEHCDAGDVHQRDNVFLRCTSPVFEHARTGKGEALALLYPNLAFEEVAVWRIASAIMHQLRPTLGGVQASVAAELKQLGEPDGDSLLTELLPLPRVGTKDRPPYLHDWFKFPTVGRYIRSMLGPDPWQKRKKSRHPDESEPEPEPTSRVRFLRSLLEAESPPRFIVCYGPGWWPVHDAIYRPKVPWSVETRTADNRETLKVARLTPSTVIACTGFFGTPPRAFFEGNAPALAAAMLRA